MITTNDNRQAFEHEYKGLHTDVKPTACAANSLFLELDTGDIYYFNGSTWKKIGEA